MDSPERNLTITPAEVQGSPLFNFLCSLSPIKPVKSVHVAQTFSELSFPPPPAVFVSPRVDAQKDSSLQRDQCRSRVELVQAGSGSCELNVQTDNGQLRLNLVRTAQKLGCSKKIKDVQDKDHSVASPCSSPSKLVEQYLAEPVEEELHTVDSGLSAVSNTCDTKANTLQPDFMNVDSMENVGECKLTMKGEVTASSSVPLKLSESDGGVVSGAVGMGQKRTDFNGAGLQDSQDMDSAKKVSSVAPHQNSQGNDEEVLDLDQESSDFVFLLSEGGDNLPAHTCMDDWQSQTTATLSELSIQHMAGYLATMREIVNEEAQELEMDGISTHLTTDMAGDKRSDAPGMCKHAGDEPEAGVGVSGSSVDVPPQRGVRRRCLDFEVTEAQWKSKNSICSLKSMCSNSNTSSQIARSCGLDSNIPLSVLRERAAATSGATNSESIQGLDTCTHPCSRIEETASTKIARVNSTMLRLSRCSSLSLKDSEFMPTKPDSQLVCAPRPSGTSPLPVGMPSGIGLHLNSLKGSMSFSQPSRENDGPGGSTASLLGMTPLSSLQDSTSDNYGNCVLAVSSGGNLQAGSTTSFRPGLVVSLVEKTRMDEHEVQSEGSDQIVGARKSMTCFRSVTLGIKQLEDNLHPCGLEKKPSPLGRKRVLLQDFPGQLDLDGPEDSCQSPHSPKKKRKSAATSEKSGDGCKRCNCKKSKCLKLYCECFAAGVYCVDSCTCHDCFNKPEFEDTVLGTRQLIESRNPLAFAPKIIRAADSSPTNGEECGDTPASARHKRGCNCKKSQCLKKYCECFQAGVGCSDGCRCESCKNVYGRKEGSEDMEGKDFQVEMVDKERVEEQIDTSDFHNGFSHASQQQNTDLSPITPSFQYSGQSRSTVKPRSASKRRFPTEELHSPAFALSSAKPPRSPSRLLRSSKGAQNSSTTASTEVQLSNIAGSPISTPKMLRIGQFSPRWDGLGDICTLTPLPQPPLRPTPASTSVLEGPDSSPSFNGQHCNELSSSANGSVRASSKFSHGSSPTSEHPASRPSVSNHHFQTPVNVQRIPMTPIFSSPLRISGGKCGYEDSDVFGQSAEDDNTPEFLKDPDEACSPVRILKTSSPKQKRVSPPHHQGSREASNRGMRSPGLRSSRKFILQSIPSVPPTPFLAVHEQANGNTNEG